MSPRYRNGANQAGTIVAIVADIMALILGLWILMYLLDANPGNAFVQFIHDAARWLAGWSHDLFTFDEAWARVVVRLRPGSGGLPVRGPRDRQQGPPPLRTPSQGRGAVSIRGSAAWARSTTHNPRPQNRRNPPSS